MYDVKYTAVFLGDWILECPYSEVDIGWSGQGAGVLFVGDIEAGDVGLGIGPRDVECPD